MALAALLALQGATSGGDEEESPAVGGHVLSKEGKPVVGVEVTARRGTWILGSARTDDAGRFRVRTVDGGPVDLHVADRVVAPARLVWEGEVPGVAPGTMDVRLVARSSPADRALRVEVTCPFGPVEGIEVYLSPPPVGVDGYGRTNSSGFIRFGGLTSREVTVEVAHRRPWTPARIEKVKPEGQLLALALERKRAIAGRVVDSKGRPVVGFGVLPEGSGDTAARPVGDITGVEGQFRVFVPWAWKEARIRAGVTSPWRGTLHSRTATATWSVASEAEPVRIALPAREREAVATDGRQRDIVSIYRLILKQEYIKSETKRVVLVDPLDETVRPRMNREVMAYTTLGPGMGSLRDRVHPSAWNALFRAAAKPSSLPDSLALERPTHVLSRSWWWFLRRDWGDGFWTAFYRKFPNSPGVIDLMPVAFSEDGNEALVHVSRFFGFLAGAGDAYVLKRSEDGWKITARASTWTS